MMSSKYSECSINTQIKSSSLLILQLSLVARRNRMNIQILFLIFMGTLFQLAQTFQIKRKEDGDKGETKRNEISHSLYNEPVDHLLSAETRGEPKLISKRHIGRWMNFQYMLRNHKKQNANEIEGKRNIGRWLNRNWVAARWNDRNLLNTQPDSGRIVKRFIGRWRNRNYLLSKLNQQIPDDDEEDIVDDDVMKRGIGRWSNRNYILSRIKADNKTENSGVTKRFLGRWLNRNWLLSRRNQNMSL